MSNETPDVVHGQEAERWGGWSWREPSRGEHFRRCSYCGSIHPEDLAAEPDWRADWADMKYGWPHKFYIPISNRTPEQQFIISASNADEAPDYGQWIPVSEIPETVNTEGWSDLQADYNWVQLGTRRSHYAKFYSVHLADPTIDPSALEDVQRISGRRLRFSGGRVSWEPFEAAG